MVHQVCAPLHPERFRQALASMAEGCCGLRGQVWLAVAPEHRVTVQGIGPRVWLENAGPWPVAQEADLPLTTPEQDVPSTVAEHPGERRTWLAATGEGMDAAEFARLLSWCELTEAEMMSGTTGLADPFDLNTTQ
ncbi:GTP-binding protein [Kocuria sabuli]|uniref:GTP-binding protein n=1 Tax=Kocuria sabuli TaxID=3071448 RepID=UPI0034D54D8C